MNKVHVKTGDKVIIISGRDKGKEGKVLEVSPSEGKVIVESNRTAWPWVLGEGGHSNHYPVGGPFTIKIEAEDGNGNKLVKEFAIPRINRSISF